MHNNENSSNNSNRVNSGAQEPESNRHEHVQQTAKRYRTSNNTTTSSPMCFHD